MHEAKNLQKYLAGYISCVAKLFRERPVWTKFWEANSTFVGDLRCLGKNGKEFFSSNKKAFFLL